MLGFRMGAVPREITESRLSSHSNSHLLRAKCVQLLETEEAGLEHQISVTPSGQRGQALQSKERH